MFKRPNHYGLSAFYSPLVQSGVSGVSQGSRHTALLHHSASVRESGPFKRQWRGLDAGTWFA
jgi:hypothetical protein